jgi:hypothetical protein
MENVLRFIRDSTTYYSIDQPDVYFYDIGLNPINYFTIGDSIEGTRFLFAMWECFISKETDEDDLYQDLYRYFDQYDQTHFSYWTLLDYEILSNEESHLTDYEIDSASKDIILFCKTCKMIIPYPYENIKNEDGDQIDEKDFAENKKLSFEEDDQFPILFMSDEQMSKNSDIIYKYYQEIVTILKSHEVEVNSINDLFNFYSKNCSSRNGK